ncbi:MAG: type II secretion system F family protein [Candidatus Margulisbacteria bacterium]|jgi:general secretion pathway protein F|nr:type II secretion system F family protein [Candidatus Margulisiibacteriota bacterium]
MSNLKLDYEKLFTLTKELGFLLRSGVTLYSALQIIRGQNRSRELNIVLDDFLLKIAEGSAFSACLAVYPKIFSPFYRQLIVVGESKGELESALKRIELYLAGQKRLRETVINAVTYPAILTVLGLLILSGMLLFVFPRFAEIFLEAGIPLPLPTRSLIFGYKFAVNFYPHIFAVLAGGAAVYTALLSRPGFRLRVHALRLGYPLLGRLLLTAGLAGFTGTLGALYASGVPLLDALYLSQGALANAALRRELDSVIVSARDGKGMAQPLSRSRIFPPLLAQMAAVGEESGALDKVLSDCAEYYEQETEFLLKRYLSLLEPAALLIIAVFVMLIAAAVMLPLFRMSAVLRA